MAWRVLVVGTLGGAALAGLVYRRRWHLVTAGAIAALLGFVLFDDASPSVIAFVLAFAGGAILTMLADTMMPEAYAKGGKWVGVVTTLGFATAFAISAFE